MPMVLLALAMMAATPALAAWQLENVMVTSYSVSGGAQAPPAGLYDLEYRSGAKGRLVGTLSRGERTLARDLPLVVSKCRAGRVRPKGEFRRPRRGARKVQLVVQANINQPGTDPRKPRVCDIELDLDLAAVMPGPQASPPNPGRPGQPPD